MYGYFIGRVEDIGKDSILLEVNQIGYEIRVGERTSTELMSLTGNVKIYTYTCVREDEISLYGFLTKEELELFKKVIAVSGIGPKGGLALLSNFTVEEFCSAIEAGDDKGISKAPGIGLKTAQRLILELKGKLDFVFAAGEFGGAYAIKEEGMVSEAVEALTSLGYSVTDAKKAVAGIPDSEHLSTEEILKIALKNMYR